MYLDFFYFDVGRVTELQDDEQNCFRKTFVSLNTYKLYSFSPAVSPTCFMILKYLPQTFASLWLTGYIQVSSVWSEEEKSSFRPLTMSSSCSFVLFEKQNDFLHNKTQLTVNDKDPEQMSRLIRRHQSSYH